MTDDARRESSHQVHAEKFRVFYPEVCKRVLAYIRFHAYRLRSEAIDDAKDEVMARLWASWSKKSINVDPIPLAMVIARNYVINEMIKMNTRTIVSVDEFGLGASVTSSTDIADECSELLDTFTVIRELPEDLREIAAWIYLCDLSRVEIAKILGVRKRVVRARIEEIRQQLQKSGLVSSLDESCDDRPSRPAPMRCRGEQHYKGTEGWAR